METCRADKLRVILRSTIIDTEDNYIRRTALRMQISSTRIQGEKTVRKVLSTRHLFIQREEAYETHAFSRDVFANSLSSAPRRKIVDGTCTMRETANFNQTASCGGLCFGKEFRGSPFSAQHWPKCFLQK